MALNCLRVGLGSAIVKVWLWSLLAFTGRRCTLEDEFNVVLANPRHVKAIPGRKTDQSDGEWLANLLRNGLVKPSYVPDKRARQLWELTRLRVKFVETRTDFKNRCHKILERANIRLSSALSCAFGRAGTLII
jgi:transposase